MKASMLAEILLKMVEKHGDHEPVILDDETGEWTPVASVFLYNDKGEKRFDLTTERQSE